MKWFASILQYKWIIGAGLVLFGLVLYLVDARGYQRCQLDNATDTDKTVKQVKEKQVDALLNRRSDNASYIECLRTEGCF